MLFTTLRQLASISGRAILAIGLTSATVLALAPSAKAEDITVVNPPYFNASALSGGVAAPTPSASGITPYVFKQLTVQSNKAFDVSISGPNMLKLDGTSTTYQAAYTVKVGNQAAATPNPTAASFYTGTATEALSPETLDLTVTSTADFTKLPPGNYTAAITVTASQP